jgi:hypothetical protein
VAPSELRRKTPPESKQPFGISPQSNPAGQQGPEEIGFFGQEFEPSRRISRDMHIRLPNQAVLDSEVAGVDRQRGFRPLASREREMVGRVQISSCLTLESQR